MLSRKELLNAINDCETANESFQNCQKLATLYIIYDHLYSQPAELQKTVKTEIIETDGDSDFLKLINGRKADDIIPIIDELMETIKVLQPKLYESILRRIEN